MLTPEQQTRLNILRTEKTSAISSPILQQSDPNLTVSKLNPEQQQRLATLKQEKVNQGQIISAEEMTPYEKMQTTREQLQKENMWDESATAPPEESKLKQFGRQFIGDLPENVGATTGSLIGAKYASQLPVPPALKGTVTLAGALGGAYLGGASGRGYKETYKQLAGLEPPKHILDIYKSMNNAGLEQAAYEFVGQGIAKIGKTVVGAVLPRSQDLIKGAPEADELLKKYGGGLTPSQMSEHALTDKLEDVAESSFFGGQKIYKLKNVTNPDAIRKIISSLSDDFALKAGGSSLSDVEIGMVVKDTIEGGEAAFKKAAKKLYKNVDSLAKPDIIKVPMDTVSASPILDATGKPVLKTTTKLVKQEVGGAVVDVRPLKKFAIGIQDQIKNAGKLPPASKRQLIDKISKLNDTVNFETAQEIRSDLRQLTAQLAMAGDETKGISRKLHQLVTFEMSKSAKNLSPEAYDAWRMADQFYRSGKMEFNNKLIKTLTKRLEERPEIIADWLSAPNAVSQAEKLKAIVPEKTWQKVKYAWLENLITKNADDTGLVKGQTILNKLEKQKNLSNIFSPEEITSITNVFKAAAMAQSKTGAKGGGMLIQLMQAGPLVMLASGNFKKTSYFILIVPSVLAQLYTNPTTAKWIAMGQTLPVDTPEAMALGTRIIAEASKIYSKQLNEESDKRQQQQIKQHRQQGYQVRPMSNIQK